jgi:hypothetical protein
MSIFLKRQTVRKRRRWTQRLRQAERAFLSLLVIAVGLVAVYGLYRLVFLGDAFRLEKMVIEGRWHYLSAGRVAELAGVEKGDNIFWISVPAVYERLRSEPWVKEAAVRRRLPDTLSIFVEEHRPVAIVAGDGFSYVDAGGKVIKRVEVGDDRDFPVITGIGGTPDADGPDEARLAEAAGLIAEFTASEFGQRCGISELSFDGANGYSIFTRREPMQIVVGSGDLDEKIAKIVRMSRAIAERPGRIQYMLVNEAGRIVVRYRSA